ncbi:ulp1 protease family, C-terminal catalytic domain-containing protein [Tanacetum coccineum]|uniref:Ulp1 protease family, C-terminal catalytic domain-containing protein n=1 Tax=Tanacetum coccineum TaxID=301880 RepID=A0ABQ5H4U5_9ASTR
MGRMSLVGFVRLENYFKGIFFLILGFNSDLKASLDPPWSDLELHLSRSVALQGGRVVGGSVCKKGDEGGVCLVTKYCSKQGGKEVGKVLGGDVVIDIYIDENYGLLYILGEKDYKDSVDGKVDFNSRDVGIAKDDKDVDTHGGYNGSEVEYGKNTDIWVDNDKSIGDNGKSIVPFDDLESNINVVLAQSPYKSFHNFDLVFFPMITTKGSHHFYLMCFNTKTAEIDIIDNLNNDVDDIGQRYGNLPIYLLKPDEGLYKEQKIDPSDSYKANSFDSVRSVELVNNDNIKKNGVDSKTKEYGTKTFFERKVILHKLLSKDEKKVVEFIWRTSNNESGADLIRRRRVLESNITAVLAQSPYKSFYNVDLVFFPMITTKRSHHFYLICFNMKTAEIDIIDNLNNDVDDIDCGVFVMRHMETYVGGGIFPNKLKDEGQGLELQLRMLGVKFLAKRIMFSINEKRLIVMKQADEYAKKHTKSSRIIKDENLIVSNDLLAITN